MITFSHLFNIFSAQLMLVLLSFCIFVWKPYGDKTYKPFTKLQLPTTHHDNDLSCSLGNPLTVHMYRDGKITFSTSVDSDLVVNDVKDLPNFSKKIKSYSTQFGPLKLYADAQLPYYKVAELLHFMKMHHYRGVRIMMKKGDAIS